jgi:ligand-binding SRPBCC domain-containing protein
MPEIFLKTKINAPAERCFLLSLSIDLHMATAAQTKEKAIAGVTEGIMKLNEAVTWRAKHLGFTQRLTSKITEYKYGEMFVDEMQEGTFKMMHHRHSFKNENGFTNMTDVFRYEAPFGFLGKITENLFLTNYLIRFLQGRNKHIKKVAEGDEWKMYIK